MPTCTKHAHRPLRLRSAISNNLRKLPGVDMRSCRGRRYRDIVDGLVVEFGDAEPDALREIAGLRLALEDAASDVLRGDVKARDDQVRLSNMITRREASLRARKRQAASRQTGVAEYLARQGEPSA